MASCHSTIIKSLHVYLPALEDEEISPVPFVKACLEVGKFFGAFGRGLHPVRYLIISNAQILYDKLKKSQQKTNADFRTVIQDLANEDEVVCEIIQRLLRCLSFAQEVMEDLANTSSGTDDRKDWIREVYQRHLEPIQSPIISRLVHLCIRICPGKQSVLCKLKEENESIDDVMGQLLRAADKISKTVKDIKVVSDRWSFTDTYFI